MDNPEKLATFGTSDTRRRQTKQKHITICVVYHHAQDEDKNTTQYVLDTTIRKQAQTT